MPTHDDIHVQDGRWHSYPESDPVSRNRGMQNGRETETGQIVGTPAPSPATRRPRPHKAKQGKARKPKLPPPITIPDINEQSRYRLDFVESAETNRTTDHLNENDIYSNYFPPPLTGRYHTSWQFASEVTPSHRNEGNQYRTTQYRGRNRTEPPLDENPYTLMEKLQSQIIRRKRDTASSMEETKRAQKANRKAANQTDVDSMDPARKVKFKGPCEPLASEPYAQLEIVRPGKDPNETFGPGTIVRVTCTKGYVSNIVNPNATAKCVRGRWKPTKPTCSMKPCFVPSTEHGKYYDASVDLTTIDAVRPTTASLTPMEMIENGKMINFQCDHGYNTQGGYRAGLTIAHGSSVMIQCESGMGSASSVQMDCALGSLTPETINCGYISSRKSRDDDSSSIIVLDGNNVTSSEDENDGRECGPPGKIHGSLVYKNGEQMDEGSDEGFPSGTEITFDCIASITGEQTTWKIICEDGQWIGRSMNCDDDDPLFHRIPSANGSCMFRNNEPHVVSFYNDLEIREDIVEFPPGTTIISR
uniref:Sushi domain-containing protein n=1 Tax=Anopheles maculatus TaxID=74869 RepID=A0A182T8G8_9DIPT